MLKNEEFNFIHASDDTFKNIWLDQKGIVIGRGNNIDYIEDKALDNFNGKKIGCNSAYRTTKLDVLVWMDSSFYGQYEKEMVSLVDGLLKDTILFAVNPIYYIHKDLKVYALEARQPERCSESFDFGFYPCELSGYIALNIAILMGLNPIWLYGFLPNEKLTERNLKFKYIADWCLKNDRKVYVADEESSMRMFFDYKPLILTSTRKRKRKG